MPTSYLPQRLIHAHLPSSSTTRDEAQIPVITEREFPTTDETEEPLSPDHATSTILEHSTGILARVTHNGYLLNLSNFALTSPSHSSPSRSSIKIAFPDRLRPLGEGCIIPYPDDGRVYILVVTETDVVYRLKLSMSFGEAGVEMTNKGMDDWCEEWEVPEETLVACGGVGAWRVIDEDTIVLGGADGGIVRLTRAGKWGRGASWSASHQRPASKFRLPSIFSRSASSDELVVSTALYALTSGSLLYTLSRDYKLRSWNSVTGSLLRTLDIRSSFPSSQELVIRGAHTSTASDTFLLPDTTDVPLVQVVTHPSSTSRYSHLLVIFLATPLSTVSAGSFVVYRVTSGNTPDLVYAGHRECSMMSAMSNLRGFQITSPTSADHAGTGWRLAVVWEKRGLTYGETICVDDIFQFATTYEQSNAAFLHDWHTVSTDHEVVEKMDTAYFDKLISLDPPNPTDPHDNIDIAQTFSQHLFYPGRFSSRDLETALADYLSQPGRHLSQLSAPSSTLSGRFETIVGCDLEMAIDPQTGAPIVDAYREAMKRDWLSIWARVRDLDKHSRYPLATTEVDGHVVIHTRAGISAYIPEDGCGMIDRSESDEGQIIIELPESAFTDAYPHLVAETRRSAITVSSAGAYISNRLEEQESPEGTSILEDLMEHIDTTLASAEVEPLESRCEALWEDMIEPHFGEDDQLSLRRIMSNTPHERDAISHTLDLLSSNNPIDEEMSDRVLSGTGNTLLTSSISSTVRSRYALSRKVLLVALYHLVEKSEEDEFEEVIAVVNRAFCVYHRYSVLRWMCEQTGNGRTRAKSTKSKREGEETALRNRHDLEGDGTDPSYSLLHSLLASQSVTTPSSGFSLLGDAAQSYLSKVDLVDDELVELEPRDQDVILAHSILVDGHADTAGRLTELYPLSSGIAYVRARALVEVRAFEESVDLFKQGASGVRDGSLACILPLTPDNGESEYYAHVSSLYGDAGYDGPAIYFGQLALRSSKSTPSKALYTRIFLSNIALGNYEDAYSILTATTSEELKGDFLGQLISVMCENNEVGRLNALGFIGFQQKVEELLSFKARNSDPLRYPNYYKVLYSWHISRGDYRSAGEIMYKQGRRFAEGSSSKVTAFDLAAMQARSYLAAINALTLVDKRNAWIALPAPTKSTRVAKRRRVTSYIPSEEWSKDNRSIDIVTLEDMQEEYALVLAQLKLAGQDDDFHLHGSSTTPEEVVGLLVQRGSFDLALSTAASLNVDMTPLFQSLARRCVELSRMSDIASDLSSASFLHASPLTSRLRGSPSSLALRYLQISLQRHDSAKTNFKYRQVVADALFEINNDKSTGWEMPGWLVHMEMERDAEAWIGRAIRWGWVGEAIGWTRQLLRDSTPPELLPSKRSGVVNIPYTLIDRVLAAAADGPEKDDPKVQIAVKGLREDVDRRLAGLEKILSHFLFLLLFIFPSSNFHFHILLMESSHSIMPSITATMVPHLRGSIEYKRPTAILLLAILTLNPSPSPLFYVTCLPALIYLHRYDLRLFILYTSTCVGLVSLTADVWGGREIGPAGIRSVLGVGTIVGSIIGHHSLLALGGRSAWSDSLLFGLKWSGCGVISRAIHFNTFTPSSARYESLRFLSRNLGDVGIDLLLAITGYTVFMAIAVFFPPPSEEDRKFSEWIKMIPLDKDAVILQSWSDSAPTSLENHTHYSTFTRSIQSPEGVSSSEPLLGSLSVIRESPTERMSMRIGSTSSGPRSYGTIRRPGDLIDLESGHSRTYSVFSFPSISALASSTQTRSAGSVDTDMTLVSSDPTTTTAISIGNELLASLLATRHKEPKYLKFFVLAITLLWAFIFIQPLPTQMSLSAPLVNHTPLSVACIIPPIEYSSADLIYLSQTVSGRVKSIIWPDDLVVNTEWQRDVLVEEVHQAIGIQYGVWTLISVLVKETGVKERILVGAEGGVRPGEGGTDWTVYLPPPTGVTRFNWTTTFPHYRPLHFAATTPSHHPTIPETDNPPSLLIIPSGSQSSARLNQAQEQAISHGTPAILCSNELSAVIDPAGRILFQQSGGQTWSLSLALWFREGEDRQWTGYERGYGSWLFGTGITILSICATISYIAKINTVEVEADSATENGVDVSPRDIWSSRNTSWSSRRNLWSSSSRKWSSVIS